MINNDIFAIIVAFYLAEMGDICKCNMLQNLMESKENIFNAGNVVGRVYFSTTKGL